MELANVLYCFCWLLVLSIKCCFLCVRTHFLYKWPGKVLQAPTKRYVCTFCARFFIALFVWTPDISRIDCTGQSFAKVYISRSESLLNIQSWPRNSAYSWFCPTCLRVKTHKLFTSYSFPLNAALLPRPLAEYNITLIATSSHRTTLSYWRVITQNFCWTKWRKKMHQQLQVCHCR